MLDTLHSRMRSNEGFTLIELLVVILIIGILAAIAIPSFLNQRGKANDAKAKVDVRTAQTAISTYAIDNGGAYTGASVAGLQAIEQTIGSNVTIPAVTATTYTVTAASSNGDTFSISRAANGAVTRTCTGTAGGCPAGTW